MAGTLIIFDDNQVNFISRLIQAYFKTKILLISCLGVALEGNLGALSLCDCSNHR